MMSLRDPGCVDRRGLHGVHREIYNQLLQLDSIRDDFYWVKSQIDCNVDRLPPELRA
jgi:hypothetical protein